MKYCVSCIDITFMVLVWMEAVPRKTICIKKWAVLNVDLKRKKRPKLAVVIYIEKNDDDLICLRIKLSQNKYG